MKYNAAVFDLDGTLTDSGPGIMRSVAYALEKMGYPVPDEKTLSLYVGPPLYHGFRDIGHVAEEDTAQGELYYHERYEEIGWRENRVYDGIETLLRELKDNGCYLAIASSKPAALVQRIAGHFGISEYFDKLIGTIPENLNAAKDELILSALPENFDPTRAVMIGDRKFDVQAAKRVGIAAIGALYGYGSEEELRNAGADMIAETPEMLHNILM